MTDHAAWAAAERVLAIRLDAMGDVLMTTPALRALRDARPGRRLTLITSPGGAAVARLIPEVDDVIVYEAPWMKLPEPPSPAALLDLADQLRAARFDAAVVFTVYSQNPLPSALLLYLAGIPLRLAHCRENPYHLLSDWVPEREPEGGIRHEVRRQLDLVATVGCSTPDERLSLQVPDTARALAAKLLRRQGVTAATPWYAVHVGASAASRRYPPESFAAACRLLHEQAGLLPVFTGSAAENPLVESVREAAGIPSISLAGDLDLATLAALIERAPLLLANNTGPAHVAAAVGTPVVSLYALTNPQHTPWGVRHRVLYQDVPCRFCYKSVCPEGHGDCLRLVPPERVAAAVLDLLGHAQARPLQEAAS